MHKLGIFMKRLILILSLTTSALLLGTPALFAAEGETEPTSHSKELDTFYLRVGAFVPIRASTTLSAESNYLLSATVDTEQTLGQDTPSVTARIEGYWRYHPNHSIGFTYYKLNQEGSKDLAGTLRWDEEFEFTGATASFLDIETIKVDYNWSFYRSSKVELALGAGLHVTSWDFGIAGEANIYDPNNPDGPIEDSGSYSTGVKVTAPLPMVGVRLGYNFTPKTRLLYKTDLFALRFDKYSGNMTDTSILLEYKPWKHVGFGGGLNNVTIQGEADGDNGTASFYNRVLGAQLFLTLHY
jgi:hypothetical protein